MNSIKFPGLQAAAVLLVLVSMAAPAALSADPTVSPAEEALRISVLYFDNTSGAEELEWLKKGLSDMLLTDLSLSDGITAVEREQLEKIITEQKFSLSGFTDDNQSIEIGKLLAAELLLTGSFLTSNEKIRIDCKLLDTETGEIKAAVKTEGRLTDIFALEEEIVRGVFDALGITPPAGIDSSKSASISAVQSYYTGLNLFDSGEYSKAVEYYRQAALEDPQYSKPRAGLEESYKFLKDFRKMRYQREINKLLSDAEILRRRLNTDPWITYGEFIMEAYQSGITDNEELNRQAEELGLFCGDSPAICAWNLQNNLQETADLSIEYFNDEELAGYAQQEIKAIAREARTIYANDPFLPELIYQELLVTYFQDEWENSLVLCEEMMMNYPENRMMWAVEDFYENALAEIEGTE